MNKKNNFFSDLFCIHIRFCSLMLLIFVIACQAGEKLYDYPAGERFDYKNSSPEAIEIANKVMGAMGGYEKYEKIRYYIIYGNAAILFWDKHKNIVRLCNYPNSRYKDQHIYDVANHKATVLYDDHLITQGDSLILFRNTVRNIFEMETYHLLLPFKLKDSGVTLKYLGEVKKLRNGNPGEKLQLTFNNVGRVPDAKFIVYVDKTDYKINRYEFYKNTQETKPTSTFRVDQYKRLKGVLFSFNRTDYQGVKNLYVPDSIPEAVFQSFKVNPFEVIGIKEANR